MKTKNRGLVVVLAGLGVNLMLGTLYAWGVIAKALRSEFGWTATQTQIPYMVACALFAFSMVPGGKLQDKLGPRFVIMISSILAGIGLVLSGYILTLPALVIGFGLIFGMAMGMGYAAPTPAAIKWFHPTQKGIISGIVVSGFGLAPVYVAPLTTYLIETQGVAKTFYILGIAFFTGIMLLAQLINNPPLNYEPPQPKKVSAKKTSISSNSLDYNWKETLKTKQFYMIWTIFCFGTFAGLLVIGQLSNIGLEQAGIQKAFTLTIIYAIFNALGRISWGVISDSIGRKNSLLAMYFIQVIAFALMPFFTNPFTLTLGIATVGFTFGGMLTVFPAITADYYGMKNFGLNYGLVITAWGIGGVFGPLLGGIVRDLTGTYTYSYIVSAILSLLGAIISLKISSPQSKTMENSEQQPVGYVNINAAN
ncbi:L-lactate MFS transporter [Anaerobranca gottschalkii]|uniref:MFS transporter, OFA family, oxalate/formate antiporter n=1 Tax=Anaerobranca gottschalkii DSM 13577 TaxID=1120990 RepID=A0A1I0BUM3_9FIRM|nr:OFA family MFS transporter [Anaerobranca gottschalkii]SET10619.1 MFS transporter, OFA family, oxalate/formate antiporter [Anaerobranca gottschalkii DSM 13577]